MHLTIPRAASLLLAVSALSPVLGGRNDGSIIIHQDLSQLVGRSLLQGEVVPGREREFSQPSRTQGTEDDVQNDTDEDENSSFLDGGQAGGLATEVEDEEPERSQDNHTEPDDICPPGTKPARCKRLKFQQRKKERQAAKKAAKKGKKKAKKCPKGPAGKACRREKNGINKNKNVTKVKTVTEGEEVRCVQRTVTREVSITKDAKIHADAIAEVFNLVCMEGATVELSDFDRIFKSEDAFAFSKTISKAMIRCRASDEAAYKCYSVTASAEAYAQSTVQAHVSAVSNAVASCGCLTSAVASSIADASVYLDLVTKAASAATAEVCLDSQAAVKDKAFDSCVSKVYGKIFAEAVGIAVIKGNCMNSEAISHVLADIQADFDAESTCGQTAEVIEHVPEDQ